MKIEGKEFQGYSDFLRNHKHYARSIYLNLHIHGYSAICELSAEPVVIEGKKERWETTKEMLEASMVRFEGYKKFVYFRRAGGWGIPFVEVFGKDEGTK